MKVLFVIPANKSENGLKISTFLETELNVVKQKVTNSEVFHFIERRSLSGYRSSKKKLMKIIQSFEPDIIHVHYGSTTALLVARSAGVIPWILTLGGSDILGHPNKGIYWRIRESFTIGLSRFAVQFADRIICVSENLSKALPAGLNSKVCLIPRGVDTNFFSPLPKGVEREKLNWDSKKIYVIFSMPRVYAEVKNLPLAEKVVRILQSEINEEVVFFPLTGRSSEFVRSAMNAADLLLVTSLHEGSPNIVKESMACNLPIVSVNCGDVKLRLRDVHNCFVSSAYDAQKLSEYCKKVLISKDRTNGHAVLESDGISIQIISDKIIDLYREVIIQNGQSKTFN